MSKYSIFNVTELLVCLDFVENIASSHPYIPQRVFRITNLFTVRQVTMLLHGDYAAACPAVLSSVIENRLY
jgi:hypothetical protein